MLDFDRISAEMDERLERVQRERRAVREMSDAHGGFDPMDLGEWLDLCDAANVPRIEAERVATIACDDIVRFDEKEPPASIGAFYDAVTARMRALGDGFMVRWSIGAGYDIKAALSDGECQWRPEFAQLPIDDPRAFDLILDYHRSEVSAWARPWRAARIFGGWPVEYRVYVERGEIVGVSNYYPQRALPDAMIFRAHTARIRRYVAAMIAAQTRPLNLPQLAHYAPELNDDDNHWTADFLVTADNDVLFLEGGPPHTERWGAHPCCFLGRKPSGVALELSPGVNLY